MLTAQQPIGFSHYRKIKRSVGKNKMLSSVLVLYCGCQSQSNVRTLSSSYMFNIVNNPQLSLA